MGIIKTAMMSGAAMYGIKQVTKAAESRHNNPSPRHDQSDRGYNDQQQYYSNSRPIEGGGGGNNTNDNRRPDTRYLPSREMQDRGQYQDYSSYNNNNTNNNNNNSPRQRAYIEGPAPPYSQSQSNYYDQDPYDRRPEYEYAGESTRSMRPAYQGYEYGGNSSRRQQGFVEPEEAGDDDTSRGGGGGSGMDGMMGMLAQQAKGMGLMGQNGGRGGKEKGGKGDLMKNLLGK